MIKTLIIHIHACLTQVYTTEAHIINSIFIFHIMIVIFNILKSRFRCE